MTATTISIAEAVPASCPTLHAASWAAIATTGYVSGVGHAAVWQRIEGWVRHRWGERDVTFIATGPGEWQPPILPVTIATTEVWLDCAWSAVVLRPSPLDGFVLDGEGPYRFIGIAGSTDPPPIAVETAATRLAEYFAGIHQAKGLAGTFSKIESGALSLERGSPSWMARAMQNSGAADLLRPWRKLGVN